jgi:tRNA (cmo5U34)-methyltransferase
MQQQISGSPERGWTEEASDTFLQIAAVAVPSRQEQIATLCGLIPASADEAFTVVELAAGGGTLATAVLEAFPRCQYVALDGSAVMREQLQQRLARFAGRVEVRDFELADTSWRAALPQPLRCALCSLSIHHLDAAGKRRLFADVAARLEPGGALLIADIVAPAVPRASAIFAAQWDAAAREQSLALYGDLRGYDAFQREEWNYFATAQDDPTDMPSPLFAQLEWLRAAGFATVDAFWMRAGHAIYGGYTQE